MILRHLACLIASCIAAGGSAAAATLRYVSPTGSDADRGDVIAFYRTIQRCADVSTAGGTCLIGACT